MNLRFFSSFILTVTASLFVGCATFTLAESDFPTNDRSPSNLEDPADAERPSRGEVVVLVHGMIRSPKSMQSLADYLEDEGYDVLNWGYSSTCCSIAELGADLQDDVADFRATHAGRVHFVGHSLGNIIIRWALTQGTPPDDIGRVVMLAPPNNGSSVADTFAPLLGDILKPISELQTDAKSTANSLPEVKNAEIGIIAGKYDDKVTIEESHLPEEDDHIVVPAFHSFLMWRDDVKAQVLTYLETGEFDDD